MGHDLGQSQGQGQGQGKVGIRAKDKIGAEDMSRIETMVRETVTAMARIRKT